MVNVAGAFALVHNKRSSAVYSVMLSARSQILCVGQNCSIILLHAHCPFPQTNNTASSWEIMPGEDQKKRVTKGLQRQWASLSAWQKLNSGEQGGARAEGRGRVQEQG